MSPIALLIEDVIHLFSPLLSPCLYRLYLAFFFDDEWPWTDPSLLFLILIFFLLQDDYNNVKREHSILSKIMQASYTTHDFQQEEKKYKCYKPIKHIRSNDNDEQRQFLQNHSSVNNTRSMSSSFRHSVRHLTSCASSR